MALNSRNGGWLLKSDLYSKNPITSDHNLNSLALKKRIKSDFSSKMPGNVSKNLFPVLQSKGLLKKPGALK